MPSAIDAWAGAGDQEAQGFRKPDRQHGADRERRDAAEPEDCFPAILCQDERIEEAAGRHAERKRRPDQARNHGSAAARREFGGEREEARRGSAEPKSRGEAGRKQVAIGRRQRRRQREETEQQNRDQQHTLASETIGERTEGHCADRRAEQSRREDRAERGAGQTELLDDDGGRHRDRLAVDAVEEGDQRTQRD